MTTNTHSSKNILNKNKKPETAISLNNQMVVGYLTAHPDFFNEHQTLLLKLSIPHPLQGDAISLIERRMQLLQVQYSDYKEGFEDLLFTARENEALAARMHYLCLGLLEATDVEMLVHNTEAVLREYFAAEYVQFRFTNTDPKLHFPAALEYDGITDLFENMFRTGKPQCGGLTMKQSLALFDDNAPVIITSALIPLRDHKWSGVLALGSKLNTRYTEQMGTHFLSRIGELVLTRLRSLLHKE